MNTLSTENTVLELNITALGKLAEALENAENLSLFIDELEFPSEEISDISLHFVEELEPTEQKSGAWAYYKSLPIACSV